jgi:subfamily B ATP-binding cassette protein MsbA
MVAADRIFKILRTEIQIEDLGTLNPDKIDGGISIKNLRFSYITGEEVLHGINLEIKPGEKIAVLGATGAGKSTIINLLSRFYEFDEGTILLDKNSIKDFSLNGLRKHIGIVLQDIFLFADTIYNNITLYDTDIDEDDVYNAAKEIGVHDFIISLPGGYKYNVKERGVMLSSGQRQLISFLRVYLSNPSILILDEATSSIDSYAEEMIKSATKKITKGKTSILIAHRLSTIKNADRIVVMEKGNIVEVGTHKELLANENGHYSQLHKIQFLAPVV